MMGLMTHTPHMRGEVISTMYAIQSTGRHTGLVFILPRCYATRREALAQLEKLNKAIGSATLTRTIVKV